MQRSYALSAAAILMLCHLPSLHAEVRPDLPLTMEVIHIAKDKWRVDYRFSQPVTAIKLATVADYRQQRKDPDRSGNAAMGA